MGQALCFKRQLVLYTQGARFLAVLIGCHETEMGSCGCRIGSTLRQERQRHTPYVVEEARMQLKNKGNQKGLTEGQKSVSPPISTRGSPFILKQLTKFCEDLP